MTYSVFDDEYLLLDNLLFVVRVLWLWRVGFEIRLLGVVILDAEKEESCLMWTAATVERRSIAGGWDGGQRRKGYGWVIRGRRWWLRVTTVVESSASNGCDVDDGQMEILVASNGRIVSV
ncbi:hypothetical protein L6452_32303 [Arctium lappa]|uniref:Uncharacterized protein n=1 Tax=Arctium lappa TaxID=4217 RepID=A0ACB8Z4L5_ARCLA|nr:hypothetical protein L6452_32303 [Arctium lappa]